MGNDVIAFTANNQQYAYSWRDRKLYRLDKTDVTGDPPYEAASYVAAIEQTLEKAEVKRDA
jgi:hypothetical protein